MIACLWLRKSIRGWTLGQLCFSILLAKLCLLNQSFVHWRRFGVITFCCLLLFMSLFSLSLLVSYGNEILIIKEEPKWHGLLFAFLDKKVVIKDIVEWNRAQILSHLLRVVTNSSTLWATWINNTVLKNKHFWTLTIPTDCSCIWKKI